MTKARILADYVAGGTTAAEFDYMDGVTSNVQTQLTAKAPKASPAFTGTPTGITAAHITSGVLPVGITGGTGLTRSNLWMKTSTGSENFTVPAGITKIWVTASAGGAGADDQSWGQGAGSGAWCIDCECSVTPTAVLSMTVGAGGVRISGSETGGTTSIASMITLTGGTSGASGAVAATWNGGSYSTSTGFVSGLLGNGHSGDHSSQANAGTGDGGHTPFGLSSRSMNHTSHTDTVSGYGAGGGAEYNNAYGASGGPGFIKVEY